MDGFKEFQGNDLDSAINEACDYFNLVREKLEIEIVQDAKSGIFGIVGARKAKIRARRVQLPETLKHLLGRKVREEKPHDQAQSAFQSGRTEAGDALPDRDMPSAAKPAPAPEGGAFTFDGDDRSRGHVRENGNEARREDGPADIGEPAGKKLTKKTSRAVRDPAEGYVVDHDCGIAEDDLDDAASDMPQTPLEKIDAERLKLLLMEAAGKIIRGIVGEDAEITTDIRRDRVRVTVNCVQDSGLLIGREGQTLSAVQYLLSRIVSRNLDAAVRVQMDAGDYRRKQEDRLKALAFALADKARRGGRALSTRPMSSYHRRIIHLSLQNVQDIQTRSIGEGPLKRVVIQRQKTEK
ncbi:MAG: Jag N-terminal domain-containing protein [Desulfovibrio sp.]|jgi:spoIIIJ-associated protein|nr:Jag N-terminal domain-containing protein [Desulfovibrio sp.]